MAIKTKPKKKATKPSDDPIRLNSMNWPVKSVAAQGDVLLVRVPPNSFAKKYLKPRLNRQIVPGTTRGSRHIVERGKLYDVKWPAVVDVIAAMFPRSGIDLDYEYIGPLIVTDRKTVLTHPEHGDHIYLEAGMHIIAVIYRNLDADNKARRVRD